RDEAAQLPRRVRGLLSEKAEKWALNTIDVARDLLAMKASIVDSPLVSLFVQAYNTERFVGECIRNALSQRGNYSVEVIVVDVASKEGTEQIGRSFRDPRLRYIRHKKNVGSTPTAEEGLREAGGRFVARIDSDDRHRSDFLEKTVPLFDRYS